MKSWLLIVILVFPGLVSANTVSKRLFINSGYLTTVHSSSIAYKAFNSTSTFDQNNFLIRIQVGDTLQLTVMNTDTVTHGFDIKGISGVSSNINPGDSTSISQSFSATGIYIYYDNFNFPLNAHMGLGGIISVENGVAARFFWNLKEHEKLWNSMIAAGQTINPADYDPDYFLINGKSNPQTNNDSIARVVGNVGDTIFICIANTGQAIHSIHFHGYHCYIVSSSKNQNHTGRSKDTFAVYPFQTLVLRMVPDKPGEYPVHDHNLVAVTGGNIYPNGMFLTMKIY